MHSFFFLILQLDFMCAVFGYVMRFHTKLIHPATGDGGAEHSHTAVVQMLFRTGEVRGKIGLVVEPIGTAPEAGLGHYFGVDLHTHVHMAVVRHLYDIGL